MSIILVRPALHRDDGIVVGRIVVAQPKYKLPRGLSLIKDSSRFETVLVDFNRDVIELCHGLYLNIVAPNFVLSVVNDVFFHGAVAITVDKSSEVLTLQVDVVHALLANQAVVTTVSVELLGNCSVKAIAVVFLFDYP